MLTISIPGYELFNDVTQEFIVESERIIKLEHSLLSISEWESRWNKPFLSNAPKTNEEILDYVNQGVTPFCGAKFTRLAKTIELPGGRVELALDEGVLLGGGRELPFAEVEVELKSGSDAVAKDFAATLAAEFGLKKQPKSKLARAMAL